MLGIIRPHLASIAIPKLINHRKRDHGLLSLFSVDFVGTTSFNRSNNCDCHCIVPFTRGLEHHAQTRNYTENMTTRQRDTCTKVIATRTREPRSLGDLTKEGQHCPSQLVMLHGEDRG